MNLRHLVLILLASLPGTTRAAAVHLGVPRVFRLPWNFGGAYSLLIVSEIEPPNPVMERAHAFELAREENGLITDRRALGRSSFSLGYVDARGRFYDHAYRPRRDSGVHYVRPGETRGKNQRVTIGSRDAIDGRLWFIQIWSGRPNPGRISFLRGRILGVDVAGKIRELPALLPAADEVATYELPAGQAITLGSAFTFDTISLIAREPAPEARPRQRPTQTVVFGSSTPEGIRPESVMLSYVSEDNLTRTFERDGEVTLRLELNRGHLAVRPLSGAAIYLTAALKPSRIFAENSILRQMQTLGAVKTLTTFGNLPFDQVDLIDASCGQRFAPN